MTTMDNTLPAAPRHRIRWLQRLAVAGSVGAVLLLLALVWQMLPAWLDPAQTFPATGRPQHPVAVDTCAREFIADWTKLDSTQRKNDIPRLPLIEAMKKCSHSLPGLVQVHLLRTEDGTETLLQGMTEDFPTPDYLAKVRSAKTGDELRSPSGRFTDRMYPVDRTLVLVERYLPVESGAPGVMGVKDVVPAAVRQEQWLLSALALGLVALVGISLRWLGRSQRDYQHTLQEAVLKLEKEVQARRADAEFRRDMEESINVGLRVIDREGRLIHVNRAFCESSGLSLDTLIGMRAPYLFWPDDQVALLDGHLRQILGGESGLGSYRAIYVRPDGTRWTAQVNAHRLRNGEGWIFTSTDVTREVEDQRRIESLNEQLHNEIANQKVAALKLENEAQARQAAVEFRLDIEESISVGLRVIDREGRLTHVNRAFCATSGWTVQALMASGAAGQPQYPFWPEDQAPQLAEHLHEILAGNARPESYRVPFVRPDGTRWTAQVSARALGSGEGWILASTDVTHEVEAQRRIESLNEDLRHQSAVELIGEHSGELLHKLSNQIGAAQLALGGVAKNLQEGRHGGLDTGVQIAVAAVNQLSKTVEHFGGPVLRGEIAQEPSLLHATVTDAMVQVSVYAATHNVVMYNGISKELPPITMNRTYLREVLSNLLHNAISVMDTTPITNRLISVENYLDEAAGQVQIHVRDRGPGIEPAQREAVFERHYSKRQGGSGWGLYLCRRWVHRLGGRLEVTDNHPRGADFVITLHLTPTEEALVHDEPTQPVA
ncbi:PAS domain S-box protein [uncultured Sphaerotilus sp.]|uniref:PAS domain-containing protein n=1 Tax=uncultured Sphaerotilus sp. TaxID=474984 RepID=UPI0030CA36E5